MLSQTWSNYWCYVLELGGVSIFHSVTRWTPCLTGKSSRILVTMTLCSYRTEIHLFMRGANGMYCLFIYSINLLPLLMLPSPCHSHSDRYKGLWVFQMMHYKCSQTLYHPFKGKYLCPNDTQYLISPYTGGVGSEYYSLVNHSCLCYCGFEQLLSEAPCRRCQCNNNE